MSGLSISLHVVGKSEKEVTCDALSPSLYKQSTWHYLLRSDVLVEELFGMKLMQARHSSGAMQEVDGH